MHLVIRLQQATNLRGRNISYDRLYTSIPLAKWLLQQGITSIGTLMTNRRGIPKVIKSISGEEFTYNVSWEQQEKKLNLHSYLVKTKSCGMSNVLVLSTMQPLLGTVKEGRQPKPALYKLYDFTKGGTDIIDQRMGYYSCKPKSPRWTITALSYMLDTCRVNASTVLAMNDGRNPREQDASHFLDCLQLFLMSKRL